MSDTTEVIAERLATLRRERGMTQDEISRFLNISRGRYANWETGLRSPKLDELASVADKLGVPAGWIVGWTNERSNVAIGGAGYVTTNRTSVPTKSGSSRITNAASSTAYSVSYLRHRDLDETQCVSFTVCDDDMKEVCKRGDEILVDRRIKAPGSRDLFGILVDGQAWVRWIRRNLDNTFTVYTEATDDEQTLTREAFDELDILGRVARIASDR
ncbi:helix-turn-helix domain-containing protein [Salinicola corii]|uniref:Helix-turn-helix domain-containing protein n=1 Tax=Salinicola corii TaxID=2606937 RepID=A0A640W7B7_9GAMM|nr:helix-turn-helix transcriptional regulator [Salinicola corii]KAA0015481.1 helix-turn-helix domain-containing protein [Salinicola corii]